MNTWNLLSDAGVVCQMTFSPNRTYAKLVFMPKLTGYSPRMRNNARRMNQNQRYEVLMHFPGYECLMAFPGSSTPQIARLRTKNSRQPSAISFQDARLVRLGRKIILGLGKKGKEHILFCDLYPFLRFCVKGV